VSGWFIAGRSWWSLHAVVPRTTTAIALSPAWSAGFALAAGRRLPPSSSIRSVRPHGRIGRLLTQPPDPHRLLAHLLAQAHQLLPVGSALLAGVACLLALLAVARARARRRLARSLTCLEIRPGRDPVDPAALERSLAALHGLLPAPHRRLLGQTPWLVLELQRHPETGLAVRLITQRAVLPLASASLRSGLPGCELHPCDPPQLTVAAGSARGYLRQHAGRLAPLRGKPEPVLPALLAALESEHGDAIVQLTVQPASSRWLGQLYSQAQQLQQGKRKRPLASTLAELPLTLTQEALTGIGELIQPGPSSTGRSSSGVAGPAPTPLELERAQALRARARSGVVAFNCGLRFACHSDHPARSKAWAQALQAQLRPLDGPHNGLAPKRVWAWQRGSFDRALQSRAPEATLLLTAAELVPLFALSGDKLQLAELEPAGARQVPPPLTLTRQSGDEGEGRPFAQASYPGRERDVRLSRVGARTHLHVIGPPGSGKTSMLLRLALASAQTDGTGIWEAKGDLARAFLLALPDQHYDRLCLVDLASSDLVVGLNPLESRSEDERERVADDTLSIFKRRFHRFWGPQTDDLFKGALRTLLLVPGSTLLELPLLLTDTAFRARYLEKVRDPVALGPFWQRYEALSPAGQAQAIGPVLNKLRDFLFRSRLRAMLGQPHSTISFEHALARRLIMVMNLPKGAGREQAEVVGSFSLAKLWQAALARAELPERDRADFHCYLDEFQNFLHAEDFAEILAEARALRLSLCLAHQTLAQLSERETGLLLNLVRNLVCFQPGHEDAPRLARALAPSFTADDLHRLGPYEIAVRLTHNGATQHPFSARTLPPPAFDPTPWINRCRQLASSDTSPDSDAAQSETKQAAAAAAWPKLAAAERHELLNQLQPLLSEPQLRLTQRLERLDALSGEQYPLYQRLTAALRTAERAQLLDLSREQIEQRIVAVALDRARRRHDAEPEEADEQLLGEVDEEAWASAVEREKLERLQRISALRYGRPVDEVELAIRRRLGASLPPAANDDGIEKAA
jgi:hypothetical protein